MAKQGYTPALALDVSSLARLEDKLVLGGVG